MVNQGSALGILTRAVTAVRSFIRMFSVVNLLLAIMVAAAPCRLHAQYERMLRWTYKYDPPGKQGRTWTQIDANHWIEVCENGPRSNFTLTNSAAVLDGNRGQIVEREDHALSVFIPNVNANGKDPDWLRVFRRGDVKWAYLGRYNRPVPID